ncbi:MAG: linear amide C-N hydrolase [Clostridia bacterium]|nr:linear amide C-N hydrolase [Clostridia bacterium]
MKNRKELRALEDMTLRSLKKVNDDLFMLEYHGDYSLDKLLEHGSKGILGTVAFMQKELKRTVPLNPAAGRFGCSAFNTVTERGERIMGRNFDYKESPCIILWTAPEGGYRSMSTLTSNFMLYGIKHARVDRAKRPLRLMGAPFVAMDGINEKGLAIAILEIKSKPTNQDTGKTPIIPPVAVRAVLDTCSTVEEGIAVFEKYDMHDLIGVNYHYMLADDKGASAVIEYVEGKMNVIRQKSPGERLTVTNYYLTPGADKKGGRGYDRLKNISSCLTEHPDGLSEEEAMRLLSRNTLHYHHKWMPHMVITVWSTVFDLTGRSQLTCAAMNYEKAYRFSLDKPLEYEEITLKETENGRQ